jgi:hypothetical protein
MRCSQLIGVFYQRKKDFEPKPLRQGGLWTLNTGGQAVSKKLA